MNTRTGGGCRAFCIAAISSGSGKTTVSLGLMRALKRRGLKVAPFKCGPDYIDPEFHTAAACEPSINLDLWMMGAKAVERSFKSRLSPGCCAVVEGVMGAFDGYSPNSPNGSSAHLAKTLSIPLLLVIDGSGMAGTVAAVVAGCCSFMPGLKIAGVLANFVSSQSHRRILAEALASRSLPPLLGCLPRNPEWSLPERHLGLLPESEARRMDEWYESLADAVEANIDIDALLELSVCEAKPEPRPAAPPPLHAPRLGVAMDDAFHFYYRDNLDALSAAGIELAPFSPMDDASLPEGINGLYIGGGFPEVFAERLSANKSMREAVKRFSLSGFPVYAECGGLMYLGESLSDTEGRRFEMCGAIPFSSKMESRLHRLGYREARTLKDSPLGKAGTLYRGHEFHWSSPSMDSRTAMDAAESMGVKPDSPWEPSAFLVRNTYASYVHAHFASNPSIPEGFKEAMGRLAKNQS